MLEPLKKLLCLLLLLSGIREAPAFSLIGPFDTWQTQIIGYNLPDDIGGPMALGEEYRWNSPTVVYGFDSSFLDYFGQAGVDAVEKAIAILNALPAVSGMSSDLSEFPLDTRRFNYTARALRLRDLKSVTLALLLEQLGLCGPERYVWTLRDRVQLDTRFIYTVVKRSFDPVTYEPSSYVNGTLYTYQILQTDDAPETWEAVEIAVDPLAPSVTSVAALSDSGGLKDLDSGGVTDVRGLATLTTPGLFYTGLTRDDVGGLRYLYNRSNLNVENLPADAVGGVASGGNNIGGSGGGSPWFPVGGGGTAGGGGTGAGGGQTASTNLVVTALRPGVDRVNFVRADSDSLFGLFVTNIIVYSDLYVTNGAARAQTVSRILVQPDILFAAADLGLRADGTPILTERTASFINNNGLNAAAGRPVLAGPGEVAAPVTITFTKVPPFLVNAGEGNQETARLGFAWGSFDASTNAPVVFPSGKSLKDLEQALFQGNGSPFNPASP